MPDLDIEKPDTPIIVPTTPVAAQASTLTRDLLILVAALPGLLAVLGTRDLLKVIAYIQSVEFAPALGVIVLTLVAIWRQIIARRETAKLQIMNQWTPSAISMTKSEAAQEKLP